MTITQTLNKTNGRFTTLVVTNNQSRTTFCARILGATEKTVRFQDVNSGRVRQVKTNNIVYARSGQTSFGRR